MQEPAAKLMDLANLQIFKPGSFCVGQIVRITKDGMALVDYPGNNCGPIEARSVVDSQSKRYKHSEGSIPVLLAFEKGNPSLPIIVGIVHDTLFPVGGSEEATLAIDRPRDAIIDGKKIVFEAKEEIVLRCGKSSVTLKKDGKVVVKGAQITSRASATNKIKGASVRIN